jgi:DNA-binding CsgD family transcriptional regulator
LSYFRCPDEKLILTGCIFTEREFEIISLIRDGMDSNHIGQKLFISPHTVDTHRRNILKKTGHSTVSELVISLQEKGFF